MPNPTTAAEVELNCNTIYSETDGASHRRNGICVKCADTYAREQVDAQRMSDAKFYTDILNKEVSKEREKSRQQVERYALTVDNPAAMHLHYDGCPFKPYANKFDVDIPDPRPLCTCAEAHKAAYWKGQWSLEQSSGRLKTRQQVEAFRERVAQRLEQMANVEKERQPQGASISRYVFEDAAAAIRAL